LRPGAAACILPVRRCNPSWTKPLDGDGAKVPLASRYMQLDAATAVERPLFDKHGKTVIFPKDSVARTSTSSSCC